MIHDSTVKIHVTNLPFSVKYTLVEAQSVLKEREEEKEKERIAMLITISGEILRWFRNTHYFMIIGKGSYDF